MQMTVAEEWARIAQWCARYAPVTGRALQPGLSAASIGDFEASTGVEWPEELREIYRAHNGSLTHDDRTGLFLGSVLPDKFFYPIDVAAEVRLTLLETWDNVIYDNPESYPEDQMDQYDRGDAGTTTDMFIPSYVPFAGLDEYHYFVDTRTGSLRHCVTEYAQGATDSGGPLWASISVMLAAHADALEHRTSVGVWKPVVSKGVLEWEVDS